MGNSTGMEWTERPIPFSAPMVRAILSGTKTQTRRVVRPQPQPAYGQFAFRKRGGFWMYPSAKEEVLGACPYGRPGDRLWVKEGVVIHASIPQIVGYAAEGCARTEKWEKFRNSRFMPRWASRITLEIADVRVQRLQEIREEDAQAEGISDEDALVGQISSPFRTAFADLWDSLHVKKHPWASNPWVWAITFREWKEFPQ